MKRGAVMIDLKSQMSLSELIRNQFEDLSEGQKKVARFILEHPEEVAFNTATQIGIKVDVSESTVIRLSYSLGLDGFTHLQRLTRNQFVKSNSTVHKFTNSTEYINNDNSIFANVIAKDVEIINNIMKNNREEEIWKAVNSIIDADRIVVIGHRISYGPAHWFSFMLNLMMGNVSFHPSTKDTIEELINLTHNSIIVSLSFPRYSTETIQITEQAKQKGAKVIAITDQFLSPVGILSDITLITEANTASGMDAISPISSLLNTILAGISSKNKESITSRLKLLEQEYERYKLFKDI
jgi:DNA-binding MurR/RpiR family transcriptional regulator